MKTVSPPFNPAWNQEVFYFAVNSPPESTDRVDRNGKFVFVAGYRFVFVVLLPVDEGADA